MPVTHVRSDTTNLLCALPTVFPGDTLHLHSHITLRVLLAGCRDHSTDFPGRAFAWQIPHIRHGTRITEVSSLY